MSNDIDVLEQVAFAPNSQAALNAIPPTHPSADFLQAIVLLRDPSLSSAEVRKRLQNYLNKLAQSQNVSEIEVRLGLKELAEAKTEEQTKQVLTRLNDRQFRFTFDKQKPQNATAAVGGSSADTPALQPTDQELQALSFDAKLQELYKSKDERLVSRLQPSFLRLVDLDKFDPTRDHSILDRIVSSADDPSALKGIVPVFAELCRSRWMGQDQSGLFCQLTLDQMEALMKVDDIFNDKRYFEIFLLLKFQLTSLRGVGLPDDQTKRAKHVQKLEKLLAFLDNKPPKYDKLRSAIFLYYLYANAQQAKYSASDLEAYLKRPFEVPVFASDGLKSACKAREHNEWQTADFLEPHLFRDFVSQYLQKVLEKESDYKRFVPYFDAGFLQTQFAMAKATTGSDMADLKKLLSDDALKELYSSRRLSITHNPARFDVDQPVRLRAVLKNIQTLTIRVFQINTLGCLLNDIGSSSRYESLELHGLQGQEEYAYKYDHSAVVAHEESFEIFAAKDNPMGVYIVDFYGGELWARAVVRVGTLSVVSDGRQGRTCSVVDQHGKVCIQKGTGIFVDKRFFQADDSGVIALPDTLATGFRQVIAYNGTFADVSSIDVKGDDFQLRTELIVNAESLCAGNTAALVVRSLLSCAGKQWPLSELQNAEVECSLVNEDNILQQVCESFASLKQDEDVCLRVLVPAKLARIAVKTKGKVKNKTVESTSVLSVSRSQGDRFSRVFLTQEKDGYVLRLLGIAGEPLASKSVELTFTLDFIRDVAVLRYVTDQQGRVALGKLANVTAFSVKVEQEPYGSFSLREQVRHNYPGSVVLLMGETFECGVGETERVSLHKMFNGMIEKDLGAAIKRQGSLLSFTLDAEGQYDLKIGETLILILVKEGKRESVFGSKLLVDQTITDDASTKVPLTADVTCTGESIVVKTARKSEHLRVHVLTYNFYPEQLPHLCSLVKKCNDSHRTSPQTFGLPIKSNSYSETGRLSDETIYVNDRKNKKVHVGNLLDKPTVLLKREKVKETTQTDEQLKGETAPRYDAPHSPRMEKMMARAPPRPVAAVHLGLTPIDFLANPGNVSSNLRMTDGTLTIPRSTLDTFACVCFVVCDEGESVLVRHFNHNYQLPTKDLKLSTSRKAGQVYFTNRLTGFLSSGTDFTIDSVSVSQFCFISNMKALFKSVSLLNKSNDKFDEWKFLGEWTHLSMLEKLQRYDKYCSHELNVFCYFKDRPFFDQTIKDFIRCKQKKTVIDYALLEDVERLEQWCVTAALSKLNKLELLMMAFAIRKSNLGFASVIKNYLKDMSSIRNPSESEEMSVFETLLQSKLVSEDKIRNQSKPVDVIIRDINRNLQRGELLDKLEENSALLTTVTSSFQKASKKSYFIAPSLLSMKEEKEKPREDPILFTMPDKTIEYSERQFFFKSVDNTIDKFWYDACVHLLHTDSNRNFFSKNFLFACHNSCEAVFVLSLIDLAFTAKEHDCYKTALTGDALKISATANVIALVKNVCEEEGQKADVDILISQRFFDPLDRTMLLDDSVRVDKFVSEFVCGKRYGCKVVVTNSTSVTWELQLAYEIPQGAIALGSSDAFRMVTVVLAPFMTHQQEFFFYFPCTGVFTVFPATVMKNRKIFATSKVDTIDVRQFLTEKKKDTIADVLSTGTADDILDFMEQKNILNPAVFTFSNIHWLLKDRHFYHKAVALMKRRGVYDRVSFSFCMLHGDMDTFKELLRSSLTISPFSQMLYLDSPLLSVDSFEFRDYHPLINARAHSIQSARFNITNESFKTTYAQFLKYLIQKPALSDDDLIVLSTYLVMQDRYEEALAFFKRVSGDAGKHRLQIQYDYLRGYLDFFTGQPKFAVAREVADKYADYPVIWWRNLFCEIGRQITEHDQLVSADADGAAKLAENSKKAEQSISVTCAVEGKLLRVQSANVRSLRVKFYVTDVEMLFSLSPFRDAAGSALASIQPFLEQTVRVASAAHGDVTTTTVEIPESLQKESLCIEVSHDQSGLCAPCLVEHCRFELDYVLKQEFGTVKVVCPQTHKGVPHVYVKCFAKFHDGSVKFYKDGYTDLRGVFDYISLNSDKLSSIKQVALLIMSSTKGSMIVKADAPAKLGRRLEED